MSLDINLRRKLWTDEVAAPVLRGLAAEVDVILGGHDEAAVLTGMGLEAEGRGPRGCPAQLGPGLAVIKQGAAGALALEQGGSPVTDTRCGSRPSSIR